jgi:hypothetical protein
MRRDQARQPVPEPTPARHRSLGCPPPRRPSVASPGAAPQRFLRKCGHRRQDEPAPRSTPATGSPLKLTPRVSPTPRSGMAMAYDAVCGKIVLFGGSDSNLSYLGDTWTFDGVTWTKLAPPLSPPPPPLQPPTRDSNLSCGPSESDCASRR